MAAGAGGTPPEAFEMLDAVPWALTGLGILASLVWNYFNYRRTTGLQRTIRRETIQLEEFRRIRTPIDTALSDLKNERLTLSPLASSGLTVVELRAEVQKIQQAIIKVYLRLQTALEEANASAYASGQDWLESVEPAWDAFVSTLDAVHNPNRSESEVRTALGSAVTKLDQLARIVGGRIDAELKRYTGGPTPTA